MKTSTRWSLIGLLLLFAAGVKAEGGCPPGQIPHSGTDTSSCGPIPGYNPNPAATQQQAPAALWHSTWGAIATDADKGSLGTVTGLPDRSAAESAAVADCQSKGGITCKINASYSNQCVAMVMGDKAYNFNVDTVMDKAVKAGLKTCSAVDTHCHVYYSTCSAPVQIQ
jgi:hypothetical protein